MGGLALILVGIGVYRALLHRRIEDLRTWVVANASVLALLGMGAVAPSSPHALLQIGMNLAMLIAYCCYAASSLRIFDIAPPHRPWLALAALSIGAGGALSLASGSDGPLIAAGAIAAAAIILSAAAIIIARRAEGRRDGRDCPTTRPPLHKNGPGLLASAFALLASLQILRALAALSATAAQGGGQTLPFAAPLIGDQFIIETSLGLALAVNAILVIILMGRLEGNIEEKLEKGSRERTELQLLYDAFAGTAGLIDPVELFHKVLGLIQERLEADAVVIYLEEKEGEGLSMAAQRGLDDTCISLLSRPDALASIAGKTFSSGASTCRTIGNYEPSPLRDALDGLGMGIIGGFPIAVGGEVIGVLTAGYRDPAALAPMRRTLLETLALQLGATFRAAILHARLDRASARLAELASTDVLTNLANRRAALQALDREVARASRGEGLVAVLMGDLDHFKSFNDRFGHDCGDYVLMNTAAIIAETVRATDIPSRWGGEEFLIVLGESEPSGSLRLAERLRQRIEGSVWEYGGHKLSVTITLGVALVSPASGGEAAIALADEALYQGKRSGRNKVTLLMDEGRTAAAAAAPAASSASSASSATAAAAAVSAAGAPPAGAPGDDDAGLETLPLVEE